MGLELTTETQFFNSTHKKAYIMAGESQTTTANAWFYEENGQRKGPLSDVGMIQLIKSNKISYGSSVWKKGFPDWLKIENTELGIHLEEIAPPSLTGEHVNNTFVWILAFAPIIGIFLEGLLAGIIHGGNQFAAAIAISNHDYWFVTLALNIGLAYFDEKRLKEAGHNTDKFNGWVWIVPVYLYQRAKNLNQNLAYFIVWIVCFALTLAG